MNVFVWILQIAVAIVFAAAGLSNLAVPRERLATSHGDWINAIPPLPLKLLGLAEVAAAVGLIVPPLVHIAPVLTPLAAVGVLAVMIGAIVIHSRRRAHLDIALTVTLAAAAVVIIWARFTDYPH